jgi:RimJ/RimL family protein N-acetyltransferase
LLLAATRQHLEAELASPDRLAELLSVRIPAGWPPGEYDTSAIAYFRDRLLEKPEDLGWYAWYALKPALLGEPATLIGSGGYFGPPDEEGTVEIGYSILPSFQKQGLAVDLAKALVARAFAHPQVTRVIAHTQSENAASIRVLLHSGFTPAGSGEEPGTQQYSQSRNQGTHK